MNDPVNLKVKDKMKIDIHLQRQGVSFVEIDLVVNLSGHAVSKTCS